MRIVLDVDGVLNGFWNSFAESRGFPVVNGKVLGNTSSEEFMKVCKDFEDNYRFERIFADGLLRELCAKHWVAICSKVSFAGEERFKVEALRRYEIHEFLFFGNRESKVIPVCDVFVDDCSANFCDCLGSFKVAVQPQRCCKEETDLILSRLLVHDHWLDVLRDENLCGLRWGTP